MANFPPFIRLVCEGSTTEPNYFNGLLRAQGLKISDAAYKPKDHSPMGIAKEAKRIYQEAVKAKIPKNKILIGAIFDHDGHANLANAIEMLRDTPIQVGFSHICFEFWVLLHFEKTSRSFRNCDEVIRYIQENHDAQYSKNNDHFERLNKRIPTAIAHAKWLCDTHWQYDERPIWQLNPYTNIHEILQTIEEMLNQN
jgi:RloB-like protein